jgi:PEP-CTERM motif
MKKKYQPGLINKIARKITVPASLALMPLLLAPHAHAEAAIERLNSLLGVTPEGGWVRASTNSFSDAWPQGAGAVDVDSYKNPGRVVSAWSSFAWDSTRQDLLLFGGGHANYAGNEMYVWDGTTGKWGLGSLPSRTVSAGPHQPSYIVDGAAPQSAHTYDNNLYIPNNDMFVTFGGAVYNTGGRFTTNIGGTEQKAGPYLWDPNKADPDKVGGTTGSGYDTTHIAQGGNMWTNRTGSIDDPALYDHAAWHVNGTTAYSEENGKDVAYFTANIQASGFTALFRYEFGDVRNNGVDHITQVGNSFDSVTGKGAATIDTDHNLYIRTAQGALANGHTAELAVWDLTDPAAGIRRDIPVDLVNPDGTSFTLANSGNMGIDYDEKNHQLVMWDGNAVNPGTVWTVIVPDAPASTIGSSPWVVVEHISTTAATPHGNFETGVLGKWKYVPELGAFVALDEMNNGDAGVWLYKPTSVVPEPESYALMLAGLSMITMVVLRRRKEIHS